MLLRWMLAAPLLLSCVCVQGTTAQPVSPVGPKHRPVVAQSTGTSISYQQVRRTASFATGIGATGIWPVDIDNDGVEELVMSGGDMFPRKSFWSIAAYDAQTGGYEIRWQSPRYAFDGSGAFIFALQVVEAGGTLRTWAGLSDGRIDVVDLMTRQTVQTLQPSNAPINDFTVADVDNDGAQEIAVLTNTNVYLYDPITLTLERTLPYGGRTIEVGNVDGDAALETVFDTGVVLDVTATSATEQWRSPNPFGLRLQLADIDGDGRAEVVASAEYSSEIRAWDVDTQSEKWTLTSEYEVGTVRLLDVMGDAAPEILYADIQFGGIHVLEAATRNDVIQIPNPEFDVTDFAVVDANDDGGKELIWGSGYRITSGDFLNVYDVPSRSLTWQSTSYFGPYEGVDVGDIDGDGTLEIVAASHKSPGGNCCYEGRIMVLDADTHALEWSVRIPDFSIPPSTSLHRVKLANVDADPQLEILVATDFYNAGALYVIDGLTRAQDPVVVPEGGVTLAWSQLTTGDLDGDGVEELITGTWALNNTSSGVFLYALNPSDYSIVWKSPALSNMYPEPLYAGGIGYAHTTDVIAADVGAPGMDIVSVSARVHAVRWSDRHLVDSAADNYLSVVAADVNPATGAEILAGTKVGTIDVLNGDTLAVIASHALCAGPINALQTQSATQVIAACSDRLVVYDFTTQSVVDVTLSSVANLGLNASLVRVVHHGRSMVVAGGDDVVTFIDAAGNHAPVVNTASATMHWRGSTEDLQLSATDADGDSLRFELTSQPVSGAATWLDANDGQLRYATKANARVGVDSFNVRVFDGLQYSAAQEIAVTLTNTTPTATNAQFNVSAGATISGTLSGADADGDAIRYSIVQQPSVGTLTLDATTGTFQYASSVSGAGAVAVTFAVTDGASTSQGTLQFQYQAVTSPPPTNGGGGKSGGGGSSDALLLALLASLGAIARVRRRQSIAA